MSMPSRNHSDTLIIGGGLAGLFCALKLAPRPVTIITAAPLGDGASSAWAQGGIAAAVAEGDTPEAHARDTIAAGAGLVDESSRARNGARGAGTYPRPFAAYPFPRCATANSGLLLSHGSSSEALRAFSGNALLAGLFRSNAWPT